MINKLWDKGYEPDKMIERFTVGQDRELDMKMARHDVIGSMAHVKIQSIVFSDLMYTMIYS